MGSRSGFVEIVESDDVGVAHRYPRALGRQPLRTVHDVQEEQARVYKACTAGKISARTASALSWQLRALVATMETAKIENQLEMLLRERQRALGRPT